MYFIDIKGLKKDIVEKKFTEKDRFSYILLSTMVSIVLIKIVSYFPTGEIPTLFDDAHSIVDILSRLIGIYLIYKANGGEHGEDFAGKFFSIMWVRMFQFSLVLIPVLIIFEVLNQLVLNLSPFNKEVADFIIATGYTFAVYLYAYRDTLEVREINDSNV